MKDSMSLYTGIAHLYSQLPLSSLREIESVLNWEIQSRLEGFGVKGDVVVDKSVGNVVIGNFGGK